MVAESRRKQLVLSPRVVHEPLLRLSAHRLGNVSSSCDKSKATISPYLSCPQPSPNERAAEVALQELGQRPRNHQSKQGRQAKGRKSEQENLLNVVVR